MEVLNPTQLEPREIDIAPNQRYALVGKTRSGKTWFAMALASLLVPYQNANGWEAWWIDTKHDPDDIVSLQRWGFQVDKPRRNRFFTIFTKAETRSNRRLFIANSSDESQEIIGKAYSQGGVLLIIDEYVQVVKSTQSAGENLLNVFQRGGGLNVGLLGLTQEPVYVPRQLLSQATHQFLFNVSYPRDIEYLQSMYGDYVRPTKLPVEIPELWGSTKRTEHMHGFYHVAVDYDGEGQYYKDMYQWYKAIGQERQ